MKKNSKKAQQLLGEQTFKIVIAVLCILVLIYLSARIYGIFIYERSIVKAETISAMDLSVNGQLFFKVNNKEYSASLVELAQEHAILMINSNKIILTIGESKNVDLNEDGIYDFEIILESVDLSNGVAVLEVNENKESGGVKDFHTIKNVKDVPESEKESEEYNEFKSVGEEDSKELLVFFSSAQGEKRLSKEQILEELFEKVETGEYSAIIIGETHGVKEEKDFAAEIIQKISQIKTIKFLEEGYRFKEGGEIFTSGSISTINRESREILVYPKEYHELLNSLKITHKKINDQYFPCKEVEEALETLNDGEILVTYTGNAHTSNLYQKFEENIPLMTQGLVSVEECVKAKGKKGLVVIMQDFDNILEENQNDFIRKIIKEGMDYKESSSRYEEEKKIVLGRIKKGQFFARLSENGYVGANPIKDGDQYTLELLDVFESVWKNDKIKSKILNEGYELVYVTLEDLYKGTIWCSSVYIQNLDREKGVKIYVQKKKGFFNQDKSYKIIGIVEFDFSKNK